MKFKTFINIDYSLYFSLTGFITASLLSLLLLFFLYMGWESEKYPDSKVLLFLYLFLIITGLYLIGFVRRYLKISRILNNGKADKAVIIRYIKEKNDCIKLHLKTSERSFICSLRRTRKNRSCLDYEFNEGNSVEIKYYKKNAILPGYYI